MILGALFIIEAQKKPLEQQERWANNLAWVLSFTVVAWVVLRIAFGLFNKNTDLPFDMCNVSALLMPLFIKNRKDWSFQVLYFLIMGGTTQAILTPHLYDAFPHYTFIKYFIVHCGLVVMILYVLFVFKMRPTFRGVGFAFIAMQVFLVFLILVNSLLGSNYGYICNKPDTASLLDYLGPHPIYIFVGQSIAVVLFLIYWLPFARKQKVSNEV